MQTYPHTYLQMQASNGVKFTARGQVLIAVACLPAKELVEAKNSITDGAIAQTHQLFFNVRDTGKGIAPEDLERLFVPFEQTSAGRAMKQGTGLGLSISQKYCQLMGGKISVRSTVDEGSSFRFVIPMQQSKLTAAEQTSKPSTVRWVVNQPDGEAENTETDTATWLRKQLNAMPEDWRAELYRAASQIKGKRVLELIDRLPIGQVEMAKQLRYLAESYQFEEIINALE